jgi:hypothetical protein
VRHTFIYILSEFFHLSNLKHINFLIDTVLCFYYKPKEQFYDAKAYFDTKNWIYALKKEVTI